MAKISPSGFRFPPPARVLNVNFCKNPLCANFGVPETPHRKYRAKGSPPQPGDYRIVAIGKGKPAIKCGCCGDVFPMRSNHAIAEEVDRLMGYLDPVTEPGCPNPVCRMHGVSLSKGGKDYAAFGKTAAGTPRWRCNVCRKTFTIGGRPNRKHKKPHRNRDVFVGLVNKNVLSRLMEILELDKTSIYGKIDFIHQQCMAFVGSRERLLMDSNNLPKMYLSVDRQTYTVNWTSRKDRRNVQLNAIATADLATNYVFGMHLNFDGELDPAQINQQAHAAGDPGLPQAYRQFARLWLQSDYDEAVAAGSAATQRRLARAIAKARGMDELTADILSEYNAAQVREDVEVTDEKNANTALPKLGMQVHEQYTMHAHFQAMARLLRKAPKIRVYMDQDSGFRAAFLAAYHDRIKDRTADGYFVSALKEATIDQKDSIVAASRREFQRMKRVNPGLSDFDVRVKMILDEMAQMPAIGQWGDRWLKYPHPDKSEPDKRVCWLTDLGTYTDEHAARLYLRASLHAVDSYFQLVRRRLTMAERPYGSASNNGRVWNGYGAYKPQNLAKVLDILRVYYNYCPIKGRKETPAMKLGLARGPVKAEEILYFEPTLTKRKPRGRTAPTSDDASIADWLRGDGPGTSPPFGF